MRKPHVPMALRVHVFGDMACRDVLATSVRRWVGAVALGVASQLTACSFVFVTPPPRAMSPRDPTTRGCTRSNSAPGLDVVMATALVGAGVFSVWAAADTETPELGTLGAAVFGVPGAIFTVSAVYGFCNTAECRTRYERCESGGDSRCSSRAR